MVESNRRLLSERECAPVETLLNDPWFLRSRFYTRTFVKSVSYLIKSFNFCSKE